MNAKTEVILGLLIKQNLIPFPHLLMTDHGIAMYIDHEKGYPIQILARRLNGMIHRTAPTKWIVMFLEKILDRAGLEKLLCRHRSMNAGQLGGLLPRITGMSGRAAKRKIDSPSQIGSIEISFHLRVPSVLQIMHHR